MTAAMNTDYSPVDPDFEETIQKELHKNQQTRIHYFNETNDWEMENGTAEKLVREGQAEFLQLQSGVRIRIDRIITINGKPGPKYEEFEAYGNICLDCDVKP